METQQLALWGVAAMFAGSLLTPPVASADQASRQKNKNQWRNLGIAGAAVAGYGLLKGNKAATVLGAAGAAYSANRYEQDRHHQSQANAARQRARARYHRRGGDYTRAGKKYYMYQGKMYYMDLSTRQRHRVG